MTNRMLTIGTAGHLAALMDGVQRGTTARWISDDTVREGVLRHFVKDPDSLGFLGGDTDIRDAFVRITYWGTEHVLPVQQVLDLMEANKFLPGGGPMNNYPPGVTGNEWQIAGAETLLVPANELEVGVTFTVPEDQNEEPLQFTVVDPITPYDADHLEVPVTDQYGTVSSLIIEPTREVEIRA